MTPNGSSNVKSRSWWPKKQWSSSKHNYWWCSRNSFATKCRANKIHYSLVIQMICSWHKVLLVQWVWQCHLYQLVIYLKPWIYKVSLPSKRQSCWLRYRLPKQKAIRHNFSKYWWHSSISSRCTILSWIECNFRKLWMIQLLLTKLSPESQCHSKITTCSKASSCHHPFMAWVAIQ